MRLQVLELDHVSEITQEVAAEVCREGLKGLEMLVLTATPVTPKALLHFNSEQWGVGVAGYGYGLSSDGLQHGVHASWGDADRCYSPRRGICGGVPSSAARIQLAEPWCLLGLLAEHG